jgi:hypothetical protein
VSAQDFFLQELPGHIAEMKRVLGERVPKVSYDIEFDIEGEGMYSVVVQAGDATVRAAALPNRWSRCASPKPLGTIR